MVVVGAERRLFTIEEFDRLYEVGFFTEDDRVEFIDGEIIWMSSVSGRHVGTIARLDRGERLASFVLPELVLDVATILG